MQSTSVPVMSSEPFGDAYAIARAIETVRTEGGTALVDLLDAGPVLLVFLRHAGCTFCRETLSDISEMRTAIEADGTRIVLIHMGDQAELQRVVERYAVSDLDRVADPSRALYRAFGLKRGGFWQLYGPKVWWRGLIAGWWRGHGVDRPAADPTQLPGVFRIDHGMVVSRFRHHSAADRPCYIALCDPPEGEPPAGRGGANPKAKERV